MNHEKLLEAFSIKELEDRIEFGLCGGGGGGDGGGEGPGGGCDAGGTASCEEK